MPTKNAPPLKLQIPERKPTRRGPTVFPDVKGAAAIAGVSITSARKFLRGEASSRPFCEALLNRAHPLAKVAVQAYCNRNAS